MIEGKMPGGQVYGVLPGYEQAKAYRASLGNVA